MPDRIPMSPDHLAGAEPPHGPFAAYAAAAWPHRFRVEIEVHTLRGGTPTDPRVIEAHLKSKFADADDLIRELVAETMVERGIDTDAAIAEVAATRHLNGFRRDEVGLYLPGRYLKSALKEAASVAVAGGKLNARGWGTTNKGLLGFLAEHVMVVEDRLHLYRDGVPVAEPDGIEQRFVTTFRGTGIQYEEHVEHVSFTATVVADHAFTERDWAMVWLTGEMQGIGASRSMGYGRYRVTVWKQEA